MIAGAHAIRIRPRLALFSAAAACWVALAAAGCGPMALTDNVSYYGRSNDSRERAAVQLIFQDRGTRVLFTAELPDGAHCTGRFILTRDYRALGFLPPPVHDYVGTFDPNLPPQCAAWSASGKQELLLHVSYHPLVNRFRVGIVGHPDGYRVAGDWLVIKDRSSLR